MKTATFSFDGSAWSVDQFPALDSDSTLILVFGASDYLDKPAPFRALAEAYPRARIMGCSSSGEIAGAQIKDGSLSVAVMRFDASRVRLSAVPAKPGASSASAGEQLGRALEGPDLCSVFLLSDGTTVNGTDLLQGVHKVLPPSVVVTGGLAGDGTRFQQTWVLVDGKPTSHMVVGAGLYGAAVGVSHGSRGGWDVFGPERVVTRSKDNVLLQLDGEPALSLYKSYLGDRASGLPATALLFPLGMRTAKGDQTVVRTVLSVDESAQSMTFAGDIPEGAVVQLMRANFDRLVQGASDAGRIARSAPKGEAMTVAISCVGRRLVLGESAEEELEAACESMEPGAPMVGFYSYGEISPLASGQCGVLHNQTMTITRFWEQ
jgi:hypothetical protein